ncbi:helix-turn-helix domain-containing protein [Streptomonospora arabica]|uniref:Helix-turn-helix domain-containing protein n=1 Tax=Streptomonospora arabica TaxID=412417 RepID=A0ABV9SIN6_9ACTN
MTRPHTPRRRRAGVLRRLQRDAEAIAAAYADGASIRDPAAEHACSYTTMHTLLTGAGVQLRAPGCGPSRSSSGTRQPS